MKTVILLVVILVSTQTVFAEEAIVKVISNSDKIPAYRMLLLKPLSVSLDAFHTDKVLKSSNTDNTLKRDSSGADIFNLSLKYSLPFSTLYYVATERPTETPPWLSSAFKFYVEGTYGNTINNNDGTSGVTVKTETLTSYKVGFKFESDFDNIFKSSKLNYDASKGYLK